MFDTWSASFVKRIIMVLKVGLIFMALMTLSSCVMKMETDIVNDFSALLHEKYSMDFVVYSIGNRFSTVESDTVTAYCYPVDCEDIKFTAVMNTSRELVRDDFIESNCEYLANKHIMSLFEHDSVDALVVPIITGVDGEYVGVDQRTIGEIVYANDGMHLVMDIVIDEKADLFTVYSLVSSALVDFYSMNNTIVTGCAVWVMRSDSYIEFTQAAADKPSVTSTFIKQYDLVGNSSFAIVNGSINNSYEIVYNEIHRSK